MSLFCDLPNIVLYEILKCSRDPKILQVLLSLSKKMQTRCKDPHLYRVYVPRWNKSTFLHRMCELGYTQIVALVPEEHYRKEHLYTAIRNGRIGTARFLYGMITEEYRCSKKELVLHVLSSRSAITLSAFDETLKKEDVLFYAKKGKDGKHDFLVHYLQDVHCETNRWHLLDKVSWDLRMACYKGNLGKILHLSRTMLPSFDTICADMVAIRMMKIWESSSSTSSSPSTTSTTSTTSTFSLLSTSTSLSASLCGEKKAENFFYSMKLLGCPDPDVTTVLLADFIKMPGALFIILLIHAIPISAISNQPGNVATALTFLIHHMISRDSRDKLEILCPYLLMLGLTMNTPENLEFAIQWESFQCVGLFLREKVRVANVHMIRDNYAIHLSPDKIGLLLEAGLCIPEIETVHKMAFLPGNMDIGWGLLRSTLYRETFLKYCMENEWSREHLYSLLQRGNSP
jgi:hypothetical protein